jgi:DNA-binding NarL/FixJ family response regulator
MLRVLIADDHPLFRLGLKYALQGQGFTIVAEAETGTQAISHCSQMLVDVAILDVKMPGGDGIQTCQQLTHLYPTLIVLLLTTFQEPALIEAARKAKAKGFLSKETDPALLANAIQQIFRDPDKDWMPIVDLPHLTPRELTVLKLLMTGLSNKEIARNLSISVDTVKEYVSASYRKLDVMDRVSALRKAQELGIL